MPTFMPHRGEAAVLPKSQIVGRITQMAAEIPKSVIREIP
jgi:hypothetical protein